MLKQLSLRNSKILSAHRATMSSTLSTVSRILNLFSQKEAIPLSLPHASYRLSYRLITAIDAQLFALQSLLVESRSIYTEYFRFKNNVMKNAGEGLAMMLFCERVDGGVVKLAREVQIVERIVCEIVQGGEESVGIVAKLVMGLEEAIDRDSA